MGNPVYATVLVVGGCLASLCAAQQDDRDPSAPENRYIDMLSCPVASLRDAYTNIATTVDDKSAGVLDTYAIEKEVLLLCTERQRLLLGIADNDILLRSLLDIAPPMPGAARVTVFSPVGAQPRPLPDLGDLACTRARQNEDTAEPVIMTEAEPPPDEVAATEPAVIVEERLPHEVMETQPVVMPDVAQPGSVVGPACPTVPLPDLEVAWVISAPGGWTASIVDGEGLRWRVRINDTLPGGLQVSRITLRSVFVTDASGDERQLPSAGSRPTGLDVPDDTMVPVEARVSTVPAPDQHSSPAMSGGTLDVILPRQ